MIRRQAARRRPRSNHAAASKATVALEVAKGRQGKQAWAMDITCVPMASGFAHLAPVLDRHSRRMGEQHGLPTASVVRPSQATPDPCRGQP